MVCYLGMLLFSEYRYLVVMACYLGMLPYSEMKPAFVMVVCYLTVNGACLKSWWYGTMVSYFKLNKTCLVVLAVQYMLPYSEETCRLPCCGGMLS